MCRISLHRELIFNGYLDAGTLEGEAITYRFSND
jgi:hypothetical protein